MGKEGSKKAITARQALGDFLDKLARAVVDGLARPKGGGRREGRRPARPTGGPTKPSE